MNNFLRTGRGILPPSPFLLSPYPLSSIPTFYFLSFPLSSFPFLFIAFPLSLFNFSLPPFLTFSLSHPPLSPFPLSSFFVPLHPFSPLFPFPYSPSSVSFAPLSLSPFTLALSPFSLSLLFRIKKMWIVTFSYEKGIHFHSFLLRTTNLYSSMQKSYE